MRGTDIIITEEASRVPGISVSRSADSGFQKNEENAICRGSLNTNVDRRHSFSTFGFFPIYFGNPTLL